MSHLFVSALGHDVEMATLKKYRNAVVKKMLISLLIPVVPGEPRNVKVEVINSTSIEVTWTPPDEKERHGIIRGYQIHVQNMNRVSISYMGIMKPKLVLIKRNHI